MKSENVYLLSVGFVSLDPQARELLKTIREAIRGNHLDEHVRIIVLHPGNSIWSKLAVDLYGFVGVRLPALVYESGIYHADDVPLMVGAIRAKIRERRTLR